jgi:hypothetical protein
MEILAWILIGTLALLILIALLRFYSNFTRNNYSRPQSMPYIPSSDGKGDDEDLDHEDWYENEYEWLGSDINNRR